MFHQHDQAAYSRKRFLTKTARATTGATAVALIGLTTTPARATTMQVAPAQAEHYATAVDSAATYLRGIIAIPRIIPKQEIELAKRIEVGDEDAKRRLIEANLHLVVRVAKRYLNQGVPLLDLIQEGNIGLVRAVKGFDYRKGDAFRTYAVRWIQQAVTRALTDRGRTIRVPVAVYNEWIQHGGVELSE